MGFLGTVTGFDATKHAYNAVLASHLANYATPDLKQQIAERIARIIQSVKNESHRAPLTILIDLSQQPRIVQMNFIALACNSLGLCSLLKGFPFQAIRNPYSVNSHYAADRIAVSQRDFARRTGITVEWPGDDVSVDFAAWLHGDVDATRGDVRPDVDLAVSLADYTLLRGLIDRKTIAMVVAGIASERLPFSTHDLAACAALFFFEQAELKPILRETQMSARLVIAKWVIDRKIQPAQARMFEQTLYAIYL